MKCSRVSFTFTLYLLQNDSPYRCLPLSSSISWHPALSNHSHYSLTILILVLLFLFFYPVSPEILSVRSYHQTSLPGDPPNLVSLLLLLLQYFYCCYNACFDTVRLLFRNVQTTSGAKPSLIFHGYRCSMQRVQLTTHLRLMPKLKMSGTIPSLPPPSLPHMRSW